MKKVWVIESATNPGSFWADGYNTFKGWLFATKFEEGDSEKYKTEQLEAASKIEPCKVITVHDKQ